MAHYGKSLISVFQEFFTSLNKIFILAGRLGTRILFFEVLRLLSCSATRQATRIYHVYK